MGSVRLLAALCLTVIDQFSGHRERIYSFLLRLCGRRDVADDLFQETWAKLATNAVRLREDSDLAAWLFTVARNVYRSHRRWTLLHLSRLVCAGDSSLWSSSSREHLRSTGKRGLVPHARRGGVGLGSRRSPVCRSSRHSRSQRNTRRWAAVDEPCNGTSYGRSLP